MANNDTRSAAIPTFDGKPPCRNQALTWLDAAKIFFAGNTDTVNSGQISGLATLAFRDIAAEWFRTTIQEEEANGDAHPQPKLCSSWANFSKAFKDRFAAEDTSFATKQAKLSALRMGQTEEIQRFRTRCMAAAIRYAPIMTAPPQETDAQRTDRLKFNMFARNDFACQHFVNGLIPILQQKIFDKHYTNFDECVTAVESIAKALVNQGKYSDPSTSAQYATKSQPEAGVNPQLTHPVLSAIKSGALAAQLRQLGLHQSADKISSEMQYLSSQAPPSADASAISKKNKSNSKTFSLPRRHSPSDYTQGAKCGYCKRNNHTENQCFAKKNAAKRKQTVSSIQPQVQMQEIEDLEEYFRQ